MLNIKTRIFLKKNSVFKNQASAEDIAFGIDSHDSHVHTLRSTGTYRPWKVFRWRPWRGRWGLRTSERWGESGVDPYRREAGQTVAVFIDLPNADVCRSTGR